MHMGLNSNSVNVFQNEALFWNQTNENEVKSFMSNP